MKRTFVGLLCCFVLFFAPGCTKRDSNSSDLPPVSDSEVTPPPGNEVPEPEFPDEAPPPLKPEEPKPNPPQEETPPPLIAKDELIVSNTNGLTVRSGRGASYRAIGSLDKNDMAKYTGLKNGWYKIYFQNSVGYVSSSYCSVVPFVKSGDKIEKVILCGQKLLGIPYVYGAERYHWGNGVKNNAFTGKSYDCSSLMQYIFKIGANVNLATTSREQSIQGTAIKKASVRRGDLLFFTNDYRQSLSGVDRIGHVALYLGDNYILHTASDHAVIEPISAKRWGFFINARRLL